jgi:hypothetical protein
MGAKKQITTAQEAIQWVQDNAKKGADGIKFFGAPPVVMDAALRENKRLGLRSACHHAQNGCGKMECIKLCTGRPYFYGTLVWLTRSIIYKPNHTNYPATYNYTMSKTVLRGR